MHTCAVRPISAYLRIFSNNIFPKPPGKHGLTSPPVLSSLLNGSNTYLSKSDRKIMH